MRVPGFGDRVRILPTPATVRLGLSNKIGLVHGVTTPSITGVEVIGPCVGDRAFNVRVEGDDRAIWLPLNALEFVDHAEGITVRIGRKNLIRSRSGKWREFKPH
jgi:hypothetical protein